MTINLCWQPFLDSVSEYPALWTGGGFLVFWFLRYAFGHKMYRLTCRRLPENGRSWYHKDLHDWQLFVETQKVFEDLEARTTTRCTRCLSTRIGTSNGIKYRWSF